MFASVPLAAVANALPTRADVRDLGRARPDTPVSIAVSLAYRRPAELAQLIRLQGDRRSPLYHRFLTSRQFDDYFAPSPEAYLATSRALERAGFRITHTFSNRTLIDAGSSAAGAERYFETEIHRVVQAGVGTRYASVRPTVIPAELRAFVTTVQGLNDLEVAKPLYRLPSAAGRIAQIARATGVAAADERPLGRPAAAVRLQPPPSRLSAIQANSANLIANAGFEAGGTAWSQCGSIRAAVTSSKAHSGRYSELAGTVSGGEIDGDAGLCQAVTVPRDGALSFWVYQGSNEPNTHYAWQWALFLAPNGSVVRSLYATVANTAGWKKLSFNVAALAGRRLYLYFGVHGDGHAAHHTFQFVDDISFTGTGLATPAPSTPPPTQTPYPVPVGVPTADPSFMPTAGPGAPIAGPLYGPDGGYGPLAIARGYDLPVQHGYDGTGRAAGVVIWADVLGDDLARYEQYWGISRMATTYRVAVDGGGVFDGNLNDPNNGSIEAELDVETIEGNAPGTRIYIYEFPTPTDADIVDAYDAVVSQNLVDVANSSFGSCESDDASFATATNQIAMQGAALGITFSASAGDSGAKECGSNDNVTGVSAPAGDPAFVSVGGTSLGVTTGGAWNAETVWSANGSAGGGGVSTVFGLPPYQQGIAGVLTSGRNQPDLSLAADPNNGTSVYFNGAWAGPFGGTSWASPIFSAYLTEVAQMHGTRAGFVNPSLYNAYTQTGYASYHDITAGNNLGYSAKAGFDQASGIGSISSGFGLASALP